MVFDKKLIKSPMKFNSFIELFQKQAIRYHEKVSIHYETIMSSKPNTLTFGQFDDITTFLAHQWSSQLKDVHCVGILSDDSLQSLLAMITVLKLGRVFFPISTGNSEAVITQLLLNTRTTYLIASEEYEELARICASQASGHVKIWKSSDVDQLPTLVRNKSKKIYFNSQRDSKLSDIVLIYQSSGTTGLPKPIQLTNHWVILQIENAIVNRNSAYEPFTGPEDILLSTTAAFHIFGFVMHWSSLIFGSGIILFRKRSPLLGQEILSVAVKYNSTTMATSPVYLENIAKYLQQCNDDNGNLVAILKQFKYCIYGGAPLSLQIGNFLRCKGLNVACGYGTTEAGFIASANFSRDNLYWHTVKPLEELSSYCHWEPYGDGLFHLMIRGSCPLLCPDAASGADMYYKTNDLFQEEPPKSGYWHYIRRISDIIVLSDGGKTDPVSLESEIRKSRLIRHCIVVGHGKHCTGVLIELSMEQVDNRCPKQITSQVYMAVLEANRAVAQAHSIIAVPQMVYILPPDKSLPTTSKGTIARKAVLEQFDKEINGLYNHLVKIPMSSTL